MVIGTGWNFDRAAGPRVSNSPYANDMALRAVRGLSDETNL